MEEMKPQKATMMRNALLTIAALIVAAFVFQVFLRYQYVRGSYDVLMRVDRLTQAVCVVRLAARSAVPAATKTEPPVGTVVDQPPGMGAAALPAPHSVFCP